MRTMLLSVILCIPLPAAAGMFVSRTGPIKLQKGQTFSVTPDVYIYPGADPENPQRAEFWSKFEKEYILYVSCVDGSVPVVYDPRTDTKNPPPETPYRVTCP